MQRQKPPSAKADAEANRDFNRDFAIRRAPDEWFLYQILFFAHLDHVYMGWGKNESNCNENAY